MSVLAICLINIFLYNILPFRNLQIIYFLQYFAILQLTNNAFLRIYCHLQLTSKNIIEFRVYIPSIISQIGKCIKITSVDL